MWSETWQTSKMERFAKIVNRWKPSTLFEKSCILDVWEVSDYGSMELFFIVGLQLTLKFSWHMKKFIFIKYLMKCKSYDIDYHSRRESSICVVKIISDTLIWQGVFCGLIKFNMCFFIKFVFISCRYILSFCTEKVFIKNILNQGSYHKTDNAPKWSDTL